MFKKLRNNLLITNMVIVSALVIGCLTAIYVMTYSFVKQDIDTRLERTITMCMNTMNRPIRGFEDRKPPEVPASEPMKPDRREPHEEADAFNIDIAVYCDKSGEIISTHSVFTPEDFDYSDKLKEIALSQKEEGSTTLDVDSWAYKRVEYEDGYIIAFTKNETEQNMLFTLLIILAIAGVISIGVSFLIILRKASQSIKPIEEAYNKQKQFVADASHELRTPLASISANTDVLLSKTDSTIEEEKKWLEYIKEETERMTRLTNDLLSLAKADSDEKKSVLYEVSISDIAEDSVLELEATAFEQGVQIKTDIEEDIKVQATKSGLKQIILILLDNAVKYSDKSEEVEISLKSENGKAVFAVKNTGSIKKEDLPHIFERFYRADKSRASRGYGLGLAIAKSLCQSFSAKITADSQNGKVIFSVIFDKQ